MKKTRVLGVALTLAATMAVGGAMGQTFKALPTGTGHYENFVQLKSSDKFSGEGTPTDDFALVQIGKSFLFVSLPDEAVHANYSTDGSLTAGYRWFWSKKDSTAAVGTYPATPDVTVAGTDADANSKAYTFATTGFYNIKVSAGYPAAFGMPVCNANERVFNVLALPAPSFASTQTDYPLLKDAVCISAKPKEVSKFTVKATGSPSLRLRVTKEVLNLATGNFNTASVLTNTTTEEHSVSFPTKWEWNVANGEKQTRTDSIDVKVTKALNTTFGAVALAEYEVAIEREFSMPTASEKVVRYTVELIGVNGSISRKADYASKGKAPSNFSFYQNDGTEKAPDGTGKYTFDFTKTAKFGYVYAVRPSTGPIYHLNNNIAK